ncbi:MAG: TolC family outer membrane protein [Zoogloea sp.]|uniref:TolC family outer membrane protein n=1 Tax=Zoogloea sp. TaxID=49181 RepID=UPI00260CF470|nr:TolC family outer membrane protein [Zoogloea sp.]MDD3325952.1 TolC family outer membrane protein [Zoogloea sp.]
MSDVIGQGNRRGLPVLTRLAWVLATAGLALPALAGEVQGVALRQEGNVLRLQLESEQGTLADSGVTADGRQLVLVLKGVTADAARKRIAAEIKARTGGVRDVRVQPDGRLDSRLVIDLAEPYEVLDETIAAIGSGVSQWELVLGRQAVNDELTGVDLNVADGQRTLLLRGGKDLRADARLLGKPDRLVIDFPRLSRAHVSRMFGSLSFDPGVFGLPRFEALPRAGSRVVMPLRPGQGLSLVSPELSRSATGASLLIALAPPAAAPAATAPTVAAQTPAARRGTGTEVAPLPVQPLPAERPLDLAVVREPLGPLRPMRPLVLGSVPAGDEAPRSADTGLQSIGLTETLVLGLEKDPRYRAAKAEFLANAEATPQARAAYLPTATYDFQRNSENQRIISSTIDAYKAVQGQTQRYPVFSHVLTISQPIIKAPAWVKMEQAKISVEQSRLALVAAEQDLIIRVAAAYLNLLASQDGVELARAEREATAKQAEQARVRLASGLGTITQFNETEGRFAITQAREVDALNKLDDARAALKEIVGVEVRSLKPFVGDIEPASPQPAQVEPWVAAALAQNLALQARAMATEIAALEVKRQKAGYLPTVSLVATHSYNDSQGSLFGGTSKIQNTELGVRLSMPIFEGGMTTSLVRESVARQDKAREEHDQESRKTERLARSALLGVQSSAQTLAALRKSLVAQESALQAKEEGLRSGLYSVVQVVDAYRLYYAAKRDYLQARYDYLLNRLKLKQSVSSLSRNDLEDLAELLK